MRPGNSSTAHPPPLPMTGLLDRHPRYRRQGTGALRALISPLPTAPKVAQSPSASPTRSKQTVTRHPKRSQPLYTTARISRQFVSKRLQPHRDLRFRSATDAPSHLPPPPPITTTRPSAASRLRTPSRNFTPSSSLSLPHPRPRHPTHPPLGPQTIAGNHPLASLRAPCARESFCPGEPAPIPIGSIRSQVVGKAARFNTSDHVQPVRVPAEGTSKG